MATETTDKYPFFVEDRALYIHILHTPIIPLFNSTQHDVALKQQRVLTFQITLIASVPVYSYQA
jgi:hypothetical protein